MKQGRTITELAQELERQAKTKQDYLATTDAMRLQLATDKPRPQLTLLAGAAMNPTFEITEHAHGQIADRVGIPQKYYDRMLVNAPELLTSNVNHWLHRENEKRLVRTMDGRMRAFLSDKYRTLDHFDLAEVVLPILKEANAEIVSCEVTEKRMYIKAVTERIRGNLALDDVVQAGIVIGNSEVGAGSLYASALLYRLRCLNGAVMSDEVFGFRKAHLGKGGIELESGVQAFLKDDTRQADDRAFWLKLRDAAGYLFSQDGFDKILAKFRATKENRITGDPVKVVEVVANRFGINQAEQSGVLRHLIEGGDLNQFGMVNAITRFAQDVESYDRATELERTGGQVIELPKREWEVLGAAA
jgi:hypothetical protein